MKRWSPTGRTRSELDEVSIVIDMIMIEKR